MVDIQRLRHRYEILNGPRPASLLFLKQIEKDLRILLPNEFREISEFYDGSGIDAIPMLSLKDEPSKENPLFETARLRKAIEFPLNYLILAEPPESLIVMECTTPGKVLWIDAIDVKRIVQQDFMQKPDIWNSFSDFFQFLLDEEEEDRENTTKL